MMTFEQALQRLEEIVMELEVGDLGLDQALQLFEEGVTHLRTANSSLVRADARVQELFEAVDGTFSLTAVGR